VKPWTVALVLLLLPRLLAAQALEDYDYESLEFRGIGLELGSVWPTRAERTFDGHHLFARGWGIVPYAGAGLSLPLGAVLELVSEARFVLVSDVQYLNLILGGTWRLPTPRPPFRASNPAMR
jgi:hypothetical protein